MLKSCQHCGKIHDSRMDCGKKPKKIYFRTEEDRFRYTSDWKEKREEIKERDTYLCQVCRRNLFQTVEQYTFRELEVHHAEKLNAAYEKRMEDGNLLTLCRFHHKMADRGEIPLLVIREIIQEQEENRGSSPPGVL